MDVHFQGEDMVSTACGRLIGDRKLCYDPEDITCRPCWEEVRRWHERGYLRLTYGLDNWTAKIYCLRAYSIVKHSVHTNEYFGTCLARIMELPHWEWESALLQNSTTGQAVKVLNRKGELTVIHGIHGDEVWKLGTILDNYTLGLDSMEIRDYYADELIENTASKLRAVGMQAEPVYVKGYRNPVVQDRRVLQTV